MFGRDILVAPNLKPDLLEPVWIELPIQERWFSFETKKEQKARSGYIFERAIFIKYGAILPILMH